MIAASSGPAYRTAAEYLNVSRGVSHTNEVITRLDSIRSALVDAETGQRGYIITGQTVYLEPFESARGQLDRSLTALQELVADNPDQAARASTLKTLVRARIDRLEQNIALRQNAGVEAARASILSGEGKQAMDAARATLADMRGVEQRLLEERKRLSTDTLGRAERLFLFVSLLSIGLIAVAVFLVEHDLGRAERRVEAETTARRETMATLEDRTAQTRGIVDSIIDAIITIDEQGTILTANGAATHLFGYPSAELIGQNVKLLMPSPYREEHDGYLANYRATGERKIIGIGREVMAQRKDGTTFPVDLAVSEANVEHRRLFTGVVRDLSERRKAEAQVSELQRLLVERGRLADLGAVTAQIVHDLGNPIAALSMQVQRLVRTVNRMPEPVPQNLVAIGEQILATVGRLDGLLNDLRDFSRQQRLELAAVDPVRLVAGVRDLWQPVAAARAIDIRLEVSQTPPTVVADEAKLLRVLDNLVKNAIEAVGQGPGEVRLTVVANESPQQPLRISVSDTGAGIPQTLDVFRLFETTKPNGSGLGLSIARQLVDAHGGGLSFASREPHGTVFHIDLPSHPTRTPRDRS